MDVSLNTEHTGSSDAPDQLMQRQSSLDDLRQLAQITHVRVHLLVHQPERECLVPDERLVVRLGVADTLLAVSSVRERVADVAEVPILVRGSFLEQLDPHVGDGHREAVVEADTAFGDGATERWHPRDVLRDGDRVGIQLVEHGVGLSSVSVGE
jgi:hypothetical protein